MSSTGTGEGHCAAEGTSVGVVEDEARLRSCGPEARGGSSYFWTWRRGRVLAPLAVVPTTFADVSGVVLSGGQPVPPSREPADGMRWAGGEDTPRRDRVRISRCVRLRVASRVRVLATVVSGGCDGRKNTRSGDRVRGETVPPSVRRGRGGQSVAATGHAKTVQQAACGVRNDHMRAYMRAAGSERRPSISLVRLLSPPPPL